MKDDLVNIKIEGLVDLDRATRELERIYPREANKAINKTATRSATRVARGIRDETGLKYGDVKKRVIAYKKIVNDKYGTRPASVWVGTGAGIPILDHPEVRVTAGNVLQVNKHRTQAFPARLPNGVTKLMVRAPNWKHTKPWEQGGYGLPIEKPVLRLAPIARPIIIKVCTEQMLAYYPGELRRVIDVFNKRMARKYAKRAARQVGALLGS